MQKLVRSSLMLTLAFVFAAFPALAQSSPADLEIGATSVGFPTKSFDAGYLLRVGGPDGAVHTRTFAPGAVPSFSLYDEFGDLRADGSYTWELVAIPSTRVRGKDAPAAERQVQSGAFAIAGGAFVGGGEEEEPGRVAVPSRELPGFPPEKITRIAMDLVVQGSACVGIDCPNTPSFGFDTLRLQENNLRINFADTSTSASFPTNDWRITINDSANGGLNHFSIDDVDGARTPFRIEAGAPSNSLYVDSGGRIGNGTSNPVTDIHVVSGNTPTLRLEQDGSSGFAAQTWDVAGNEANFFIRDATNGSTLPIRLRPGAPSSAIDIAGSGNVGIGTSAPDTPLHVRRTNTTQSMLKLETTNSGNVPVSFRLDTPDEDWVIQVNRAAASTNPDSLVFTRVGSGNQEMVLDRDGNLAVFGTISSNGTQLNVPDYVFEPDYELMPISDLASYVATHKHLPNVPSAKEVHANGLNHSEFQMRLLEKVEELTLYTLAQEETITSQEDLIAAQAEAIEELRARLDRLETAQN